MTIIDACRIEDEPWRIVRLSDVISSIAHTNKDNVVVFVFRGLYSLYDIKGILAAHWKTKEAFEAGCLLVEQAWEKAGEPSESVEHYLLDGTLLRGQGISGVGDIVWCGECGRQF